jgi:serine phosphatase RsbU (regulator of sigma subunit)
MDGEGRPLPEVHVAARVVLPDHHALQRERLEARLQAAVSGSAPEVLAAVVRAVRSFTGDTAPSDDITALVLRFRGRG